MRSSFDYSIDSKESFNIEVASRVKRLPPYLFAKINQLMYQKRRAGLDVIDLGMGNPNDAPDPLIISKLAESAIDPGNHRYSVSTGLYNLRREVAAAYADRFSVRINPEKEVVACLGSKEGFSHLCLALLGPGDTAIVPAPSYPVHVYGVALAAANVISLEVGDPDQFLSNVAYTAQHLYPRPKVVVINFPHNPPTAVVVPEFFRDMVRLAKRFGFLIVHDFAYADVCFDGYQAPSFLSAPGALEVGVELTTMSKGYNMAGWRIGFCAGNSEVVRALSTVKGYYDYGIFEPIQIAAIVALRNGQPMIERQAKTYQKRRDVLCEGLRRLGVSVNPPKASMFVWSPIPDPWKQKMDSIEFAMKLLKEANVAVSPGGGFGESGEGYMRLALVENEHRIRQGIRQIGRCLKFEEGPGV